MDRLISKSMSKFRSITSRSRTNTVSSDSTSKTTASSHEESPMFLPPTTSPSSIRQVPTDPNTTHHHTTAFQPTSNPQASPPSTSPSSTRTVFRTSPQRRPGEKQKQKQDAQPSTLDSSLPPSTTSSLSPSPLLSFDFKQTDFSTGDFSSLTLVPEEEPASSSATSLTATAPSRGAIVNPPSSHPEPTNADDMARKRNRGPRRHQARRQHQSPSPTVPASPPFSPPEPFHPAPTIGAETLDTTNTNTTLPPGSGDLLPIPAIKAGQKSCHQHHAHLMPSNNAVHPLGCMVCRRLPANTPSVPSLPPLLPTAPLAAPPMPTTPTAPAAANNQDSSNILSLDQAHAELTAALAAHNPTRANLLFSGPASARLGLQGGLPSLLPSNPDPNPNPNTYTPLQAFETAQGRASTGGTTTTATVPGGQLSYSDKKKWMWRCSACYVRVCGDCVGFLEWRRWQERVRLGLL